jgi:D-glycero-D-manno-heptose 1,7-bisphosphate phosphatase
MDKVVILDRDGVINVDLMTYVTRPEDFEVIEGSLEAISLLNKSGYQIAIATNQACIEKGVISEGELKAIHDHMEQMLANVGGKIKMIAYCPHKPETNCSCRKPKTGLLEDIEKKLGIPLKGKFFVGDKETDILAGRDFGCTPLLIKKGGYGERFYGTEHSPPPEHCFDDLMEIAQYIISEDTGT